MTPRAQDYRRRLTTAIHAVAGNLGLSERERRGVYVEATGELDALHPMNLSQLGKTLTRLRQMERGQRAAAPEEWLPDTPVVWRLRSLWTAGWNLGVIRDPRPEALTAYAKRIVVQPGWHRDPYQARKLIETLKRWITRESGVRWTDLRGREAKASDPDAIRVRVLERQREILGIGSVPPPSEMTQDALMVAVMEAGEEIRRRQRQAE